MEFWRVEGEKASVGVVDLLGAERQFVHESGFLKPQDGGYADMARYLPPMRGVIVVNGVLCNRQSFFVSVIQSLQVCRAALCIARNSA